jgi:hypothetical protein
MSDWLELTVENVLGEERTLRFPNTPEGQEQRDYFEMRAQRDKFEAEQAAKTAAAEDGKGRKARAQDAAADDAAPKRPSRSRSSTSDEG